MKHQHQILVSVEVLFAPLPIQLPIMDPRKQQKMAHIELLTFRRPILSCVPTGLQVNFTDCGCVPSSLFSIMWATPSSNFQPWVIVLGFYHNPCSPSSWFTALQCV